MPGAAAKGLIDEPSDLLEAMVAQADRLGAATATRMAEVLHAGLVDMRGTTSPRLVLELLCARMLLPAAGDGDGALLQRFERMERRLQPTARDADLGGTDGSTADASARSPERGDAVAGVDDRWTEPSVPAGDLGTLTAPEPLGDQPAAAPGQPMVETVVEPADVGEPLVDLEAADVRRAWPAVLDLVQQQRRTTRILLNSATVVDLDSGDLRLAMPSAALVRRAVERTH